MAKTNSFELVEKTPEGAEGAEVVVLGAVAEGAEVGGLGAVAEGAVVGGLGAVEEGAEVGVLADVVATVLDLRDPYVVVKHPEDSWLRVGVVRNVELTNWLKSQIAAGYAKVVVAEEVVVEG